MIFDELKVVATFYSGPGGTGSVVGVSLRVSIPTELKSPTSRVIHNCAGYYRQTSLFASYILIAESLEYALVPEISVAHDTTNLHDNNLSRRDPSEKKNATAIG